MEIDQQVDAGQCRLRQRGAPEESQAAARSTQEGQPATCRRGRRWNKGGTSVTGKSQFSSFILFASVIILINLCSFQMDLPAEPNELVARREIVTTTSQMQQQQQQRSMMTAKNYLNYLDSCVEFVKLMFTQPMRLNRRTTRYTLAEARMLGKMAKVWYIKKKIKKLSKKLKKHTIAVPVFTAIPIYEHSYYPQPHVTHVSHGGHHAAAASSYAPAVAQLAGAASAASPLAAAAAAAASQQQMATSASNQHQMTATAAAAYGMNPHSAAARASAMYHHPMSAGSHRIINAYAPSPPLYVDDNGGLYGHYGNAYGRYDGGYHVW